MAGEWRCLGPPSATSCVAPIGPAQQGAALVALRWWRCALSCVGEQSNTSAPGAAAPLACGCGEAACDTLGRPRRVLLELEMSASERPVEDLHVRVGEPDEALGSDQTVHGGLASGRFRLWKQKRTLALDGRQADRSLKDAWFSIGSNCLAGMLWFNCGQVALGRKRTSSRAASRGLRALHASAPEWAPRPPP